MKDFNKDCQWSNCTLYYNGYLYMALSSYNGLLRLKNNYEEWEYLGHFPIDCTWQTEMFSKIIPINNHLYFIPKKTTYLIDYDIAKEECDFIEIPKPFRELKYFAVLGYIAFSKKSKLYLVERKYRAVFCIDTVDRKITLLNNPDLSGDILSQESCRHYTNTLFPCFNSNSLYIWNSVTEDMRMKKISNYNMGVWDIYCEEEKIWMNLCNSSIVLKYHITSASFIEIKLPFEEPKDGRGKFFATENTLFFFPEWTNMYFVIDKSTNLVEPMTIRMKMYRKEYLYEINRNLFFRISNEKGECKIISFSIELLEANEDIEKFPVDKSKWIKTNPDKEKEMFSLFPQKIYEESGRYTLNGLLNSFSKNGKTVSDKKEYKSNYGRQIYNCVRGK